MNRNNELEKRLLGRSYSDKDKIDELLETRYSLSGSQKPSLVLLPTGHDDSTTSKSKSLLHTEINQDDTNFKRRKVNTRIEVRNYLKKANMNQKKLIRKVQEYNKIKTENPKKKPFPLMKLIKHYDIPCYEDFESMHGLWTSYVQNLVFSDFKGPNYKIPGKQQMLAKLSTAEFTGCILRVIESRNNNVIGVEGIVVYDTQYSFILCVPRSEDPNSSPSSQIGGFRVIPKKYTLFAFDIILPQDSNESSETQSHYVSFTLIGSRIEYRAVDRSNKKFKNHNVDDIL